MVREVLADINVIRDNEGLAIERPRDAVNARGLGRTNQEPDMNSVAQNPGQGEDL